MLGLCRFDEELGLSENYGCDIGTRCAKPEVLLTMARLITYAVRNTTQESVS